MAAPDYEEYLTRVVRLFPDYAGTPLWFIDPVEYREALLSADLELDLRAWEQFYYDGLGDDFEWRSPDLAQTFAASGAVLAQRLADELGPEFEVELIALGSKSRFSSSGDAVNRMANAAFSGRAADSIRRQFLSPRAGERYGPLRGRDEEPEV
jgi:hypothetical protein